jgi:hypothetical protein
MSHFLGVVVPDGSTFNQTTGLDLTPRAGSLGGPHFVILHFDDEVENAGRLKNAIPPVRLCSFIH